MARMRLLSSSQLAQLKALVQLRHQAWLVQMLGDNAVPPKVLRAIRRAGLYQPMQRDLLNHAYTFGRHAVRDSKVATMPAREYAKYARLNRLPITPATTKALDQARASATKYVNKLADTLFNQWQDALRKAEADLNRMRKKRSAQQVDEMRDDASRQVIHDLQAVTRQQLYAAKRVLETEANNVYQQGRADELTAHAKGKDVWVFKRPRPDACQECVDAYLMPDGKTPRLFRLSELRAAGSNVGKKRGERGAVVDSLHPHCRCELTLLPPSFGFDKQGTMVFMGPRAAHG